MPAQARKKRNPDATRARILNAAKSLLAKGDGNLEMSWVAKGAGVSQGLAYHHFGSKEGLLSAVVEDFYDRMEKTVLMATLKGYESWSERERARTTQYIAFLLEDPLSQTITSRLSGTPTVASVEVARWAALVKEGARNMAEGQRLGAVKSKLDPSLLAAMVLGAVRSAVSHALAAGKHATPKRLATELWEFLGAGLELEQET